MLDAGGGGSSAGATRFLGHRHDELVAPVLVGGVLGDLQDIARRDAIGQAAGRRAGRALPRGQAGQVLSEHHGGGGAVHGDDGAHGVAGVDEQGQGQGIARTVEGPGDAHHGGQIVTVGATVERHDHGGAVVLLGGVGQDIGQGGGVRQPVEPVQELRSVPIVVELVERVGQGVERVRHLGCGGHGCAAPCAAVGAVCIGLHLSGGKLESGRRTDPPGRRVRSCGDRL